MYKDVFASSFFGDRGEKIEKKEEKTTQAKKRPLPEGFDENSGCKLGRFEETAQWPLAPSSEEHKMEHDKENQAPLPEFPVSESNDETENENEDQKSRFTNFYGEIDHLALAMAIHDEMKELGINRVLLAANLLNKPVEHLMKVLRDMESFVESDEYRRLLHWMVQKKEVKLAVRTTRFKEYCEVIGLETTSSRFRYTMSPRNMGRCVGNPLDFAERYLRR